MKTSKHAFVFQSVTQKMNKAIKTSTRNLEFDTNQSIKKVTHTSKELHFFGMKHKCKTRLKYII